MLVPNAARVTLAWPTARAWRVAQGPGRDLSAALPPLRNALATSTWESAAWKYARCPKCYRQELSTWSEAALQPAALDRDSAAPGRHSLPLRRLPLQLRQLQEVQGKIHLAAPGTADVGAGFNRRSSGHRRTERSECMSGTPGAARPELEVCRRALREGGTAQKNGSK